MRGQSSRLRRSILPGAPLRPPCDPAYIVHAAAHVVAVMLITTSCDWWPSFQTLNRSQPLLSPRQGPELTAHSSVMRVTEECSQE